MFIGLTGRIAAGKGQVAEYFKNLGFEYTSLSNAVREEAKNKNIEPTRENLQNLGNELRIAEGAGVLAKRISSKFKLNKDYVIDGIRNPAEVNHFRSLEDFYYVSINGVKSCETFHLISIDANRTVRYERAMKRNKESDPKNLEDFIIADNRDFGEKDLSGQQVAACMVMADYHILNDFTAEEFNKRIEEIYEKIKRKVHK